MQLHTPRFILNTAIDFYNVGRNRCAELFSGDFETDSSLYVKITAPATILSFSLELVLKSMLLQQNSKYEKTHELRQLFNSLPTNDRQNIQQFYTQVDMSQLNFPAFRFADLETNQENQRAETYVSIADEIDRQLHTHDHSFVNWRYVFSFDTSATQVLDYDFAFVTRLFTAAYENALLII